MKKKKKKEKRNWTHEGPKKTKERDNPCTRKRNKGERWFMKRSSIPSTKNIHTHTYLDQDLWLASPWDLVFDLAKYEKQVCFELYPYPELHMDLITGRQKERHHWALVRNPKDKNRYQVFKQGRLRNLKFKPFRTSIFKMSVVHTQKFTSPRKTLD